MKEESKRVIRDILERDIVANIYIIGDENTKLESDKIDDSIKFGSKVLLHPLIKQDISVITFETALGEIQGYVDYITNNYFKTKSYFLSNSKQIKISDYFELLYITLYDAEETEREEFNCYKLIITLEQK